MKIPYSYLNKQFKNPEPILNDIRKIAKVGQFTLGPKLKEFEEKFAKFQQVKYAAGINSGTDALMLVMRILEIGSGDEVITAPNSFFASAATIALVGAKVVFADVNDEYSIDPDEIEKVITKKTKAILPVHWTGNPADLPKICQVAKKHKLYVIEDAAQAIDAAIDGKRVGNFGIAAEFSLHPIKNFNVWGDGGVVVSNEKWIVDQAKILRNYGLANRDECLSFGYNCRLHTLQAVVGIRLLPDVPEISEARIMVAAKIDKLLSDLSQITIPPRRKNFRQVYHTYILQAENRDKLVEYLIGHGVEAKVHYPIPLHLQKAAKYLGYKKGDFPVCEKQAEHIFSLPNHQYLTDREIEYMSDIIHQFYNRGFKR